MRELMHARSERRLAPPFSRIVLGVTARERDLSLIARMARLATRLDIDLFVAHVSLPGAPKPAVLDTLADAARAAKGKWRSEVSADPVLALIALCGENDVLAVESARGKHRLFGPRSFAARLFAAGANELLVLAPGAS